MGKTIIVLLLKLRCNVKRLPVMMTMRPYVMMTGAVTIAAIVDGQWTPLNV